MCFRGGGGSAEYGQRPYFYTFFLDPSLNLLLSNFRPNKGLILACFLKTKNIKIRLPSPDMSKEREEMHWLLFRGMLGMYIWAILRRV